MVADRIPVAIISPAVTSDTSIAPPNVPPKTLYRIPEDHATKPPETKAMPKVAKATGTQPPPHGAAGRLADALQSGGRGAMEVRQS